MKDAIDTARKLVAWALAALLVVVVLRVLINLAFIENDFERGFGTSAAAATDFDTLVVAALLGLALAVTVWLGRSGPTPARLLLTLDAGALAVLAVLAFVGAFAVLAADLSGLQQFLGFVSRLAVCALLLAVAYGCWLVSKTTELARARPEPSVYGYPQDGGHGGQSPYGGQEPGGPSAYPQRPASAGGYGAYAPGRHEPHQDVSAPGGAGHYGPGAPGAPGPYGQQYGQGAQQSPQHGQPPGGQGGSHAWSPSAPGPQPGGSPTPGYYQPQPGGWRGEPTGYAPPQYAQQYGQQYGEGYSQRYGQPAQQEPPPAYGQPYAQQYAPSQYEQQHGRPQPEAPPAAPYPVQGQSEQGQPVEGEAVTDEGAGSRPSEDDPPTR